MTTEVTTGRLVIELDNGRQLEINDNFENGDAIEIIMRRNKAVSVLKDKTKLFAFPMGPTSLRVVATDDAATLQDLSNKELRKIYYCVNYCLQNVLKGWVGNDD